MIYLYQMIYFYLFFETILYVPHYHFLVSGEVHIADPEDPQLLPRDSNNLEHQFCFTFFIYPAELLSMTYFIIVLWSFDTFFCVLMYFCAVCAADEVGQCMDKTLVVAAEAGRQPGHFNKNWQLYQELMNIVRLIDQEFGLVS